MNKAIKNKIKDLYRNIVKVDSMHFFLRIDGEDMHKKVQDAVKDKTGNQVVVIYHVQM